MDHFVYKNGVYHAEDISLEALAEKVGTPFYCYSTATLTRHYNVFAESLKGLKHKICYAVKANNNLAVLKTLAKLGSGADVVSEGEIRFALAAGITPDKIVFSGVGKTADEMRYALEQNIFQFNVESEPEVRLLSSVAAAAGKTANIAFRVNPDVASGTHAKIATGHKESKFGVDIKEALALYKMASELPGINVQGVSVHIGSQLTSLEPFDLAFKRVHEFVHELKRAGHNITTVDLGGGLGIPYGEEEPPLPQNYGEAVTKIVRDLNVEIIFEPGRLLVGNAGIVVTRVIYVKENAGRHFVIVDAGMNDLIRPTLYNAYHDILPVQESTAVKVPVDLVGPVCESGDVFAEQRPLALPRAGDLLVLRSAGAYGATMSSTYNARLMIPEIIVNGADHAITRPRGSYAEMIGQYQMPSWL